MLGGYDVAAVRRKKIMWAERLAGFRDLQLDTWSALQLIVKDW